MSFFSGVSNFQSANPYDAYFEIAKPETPERVSVCATNGRTFVELLQNTLRTTPSGATYDGRTVSGSMVTVDGRPGTMTAKVLWLRMKNLGADEDTLAQIQRESVARGSQGMTAWLKAAIQVVGASLHPGEPLNQDIRLPISDPLNPGASLLPPQWGIEAPRPTGWTRSGGAPEGQSTVHCTTLFRDGESWSIFNGDHELAPEEPNPASSDSTPASPPHPPLPPPPPSPERGGPPIPPAPPGDPELPPGITVRPVVEGGGVPWATIGVVAAGVIVVSWLGLSIMKKPSQQSTTYLRRPSRRRLATA